MKLNQRNSFEIQLQGINFKCFLEKKSIKSIRLKIISPKSISLTYPWFTPKSIALKFIKSHSDWIIKAASKFSPPREVLGQKTLQILDNSYQIIYIKTQRDSVIINHKEQKIYANLSILTNKHAKTVLEKRFRPLALSLIKTELKELSSQFSFVYNRVSVKNQISRFGSCSSQGNLNFNWQIIFLPYSIFRHILLHELTHLEIRNHSKIFWHQLSLYDSQTSIHHSWLKTHGSKLFIF